MEIELSKSGLSGNESKVYLELLKNNQSSASEIAKKISLDRTLTYTILENLINKGLCSFTTINNKKLFSASAPENLLNPLKEKEQALLTIISELNKIRVEEKNDYEIKIFEGKEGIRTVMNKILESKEACAFGGTGRAYELLYDLQAKVKNLNSKNLNVRIIFSENFKKNEVKKIPWIQIKYLDVKSDVTTTIFQDYISIHLIKSKPMIILIKNKDIAQSYRNHFEILWNQAKYA